MVIICDYNPIDLKGLIDGPPASISTEDNQSVPSVKARLLVDCRCHLGECVIWDDRQNAVLFTSILDRKFHKLVLSSDDNTTLESYKLNKMLCAFGLLDTRLPPLDDDSRRQEDMNPGYIVAWEDGFQLYDLERGRALGSMSQGEVVNRSGLPDRLNDGRVDPSGKRFVCGGCASSEIPLKVYKCEYDSTTKDLKHSVVYDKIRITNSICWSLTGEEMYLADSPCRNIRKFDYNMNDGTMFNEEVIHTKKYGFPDGYVVTT
jgi:L-arabinonolactonase